MLLIILSVILTMNVSMMKETIPHVVFIQRGICLSSKIGVN